MARQEGRPATIRVAQLPGGRGKGRLHFRGLVVPCALGPAGIRRIKREGDGATPAGLWRLTHGFFRGDRMARPRCLVPLAPIGASDGWCDDPKHPAYNRPVRLPFRAGHETMRRDDRLYDVVFITDHNQRPRVRGGGSAIFFHVAKDGHKPTAGCVAILPADMRRLLARLPRKVVLRIV